MPQLANIEFDLIPLSKNLMKCKLHRNDKDIEGIWISVSDEINKLINKDTSGDKFIGRLENDAIHFFPNGSWGMHILCETDGENRPQCNLDWVDYSDPSNRIFGDDIHYIGDWVEGESDAS